MKTAAFLVGAGALMASASPIKLRDVVETDWVTDYVTVVVTAGQDSQPTNTVVVQAKPAATSTVIVYSNEKSNNVKAQDVNTDSTSTVYVQAVPSSSSQQAQTYAAPTTSSTSSAAPAATSTSGSSSGSSSSSLSLDGSVAYKDMAVSYHNAHRSNHSVSALTWDDDLANYAAQLAATCKFKHNLDIGKSSYGAYGQNIAAWGETGLQNTRDNQNKFGATSITDQWYNGEMMNWANNYGQTDPPNDHLDEWGHFTQVVWKGSSKLGCATQYCESGTMYDSFPSFFTVCNYGGPGNYAHEYGTNVLPPLGQQRITV